MKAEYDVVETAKRAGNFRIFVQALETAGLDDMLKEGGPYTVFAPNDDAFLRVPRIKLGTLFNAENRDSLRSVLTNLILPEKVLSADLKRRDETKSISGETLIVESRVDLWINEGQVINPDLEASNGVIHAIDTVLMPETEVASTP